MAHYILFTGHMIDAKDRKTPRFPPGKENKVKEAIRQFLHKEVEAYNGSLAGIAGGAAGGDILFHELCTEIGIPSEVYLALPGKEFMEESVSFAGKNWEDRFDELIKNHPVHLLPEDTGNKGNVWERCNLWMLQAALREGGENMVLIALWDGKGGDGKGGTEHMVKKAKDAGAKSIIIDINKI